MNESKAAFIQLALDNNVLKFGRFTLKSGRESPYFFNAGEFYQGMALQALGKAYASTIIENHIDFQHLFGPAYKGLPLATSTAIALAEMGINTTVTFNRKETKNHGEGGVLIGAPLTGKTIIIDDVITKGVAFGEAKQLIEANGGSVTAVIIALDRCERGHSNQSTLNEIETLGIRVFSIITLFDLMDYLKEKGNFAQYQQIKHYQEKYGYE
jgi:orotate phosphoribosyltransferase